MSIATKISVTNLIHGRAAQQIIAIFKNSVYFERTIFYFSIVGKISMPLPVLGTTFEIKFS